MQFNFIFLNAIIRTSPQKILAVTLISVLVFSFNLFANPTFKTKRMTKNDGLSTDSLYGVTQDKNGFIWFYGESGLQRYDGNDFVNFSRNSNNKARRLNSNVVREVLIDHNNDLWIGTDKGLNIYNQKKERVSLFDFGLHGKQHIAAKRIRSLYQSSDNSIWIGSYAGLTRYQPHSKEITHFTLPTVRAIYSIDRDTLIIGTLGKGLYLFDIKTGKSIQIPVVQPFTKQSLNPSIHNDDISIIDIYEDNKGKIFVSSWGKGLFQFNAKEQSLLKINLELPSQYVRSIRQDNLNQYWIVCGDGIVRTDNQFNNLMKIPVVLERSYLDIQTYRKLYFDEKNRVWIPTYGFGIYLYNPSTSQFEFYTKSNTSTKGLLDFNVAGISELQNGQIVIVSSSGLISQFNSQTGLFKNFQAKPSFHQIIGEVYSITSIQENSLLIQATENLFRFDINSPQTVITQTKQYDFLNNYFLFSNFNSTKYIPAVEKLTNNLVMLSVNEDGDLFVKIKSDIQIPDIYTSLINISDDQFILLKPRDKIIKVKIQDEYLVVLEESKTKLDEVLVFGAFDNKRNLWIGGLESGVFVVPQGNIENNDPILAFETDLNIYNMLMDKENDLLWIVGEIGLYRYNLLSKELVFFDESDGLQGNEFSRVAFLASDGAMYFGGVNGFNRFFSKEITLPTSSLPVKLTQFFVNNNIVISNDSEGSILSRSIVDANEANLTFDKNNFGIEFSALEFSSAQKKLIYAYILEGYETQWHHVDYKKRYANYTNIPDGVYNFRVKVKNRSGLWSEKDRVLKITITPPWWKTKLAYLCYFLLIAFAVYAVVSVRTRVLIKRSEKLTKIVKRRTKEVELLLENKNQELANVSHEFRTPLTLILGPVAKVLKSLRLNYKANKTEIEQLEVTERNSYRLLRMVDQLLDIESFQVKSIVQKQAFAFGESSRLIVDAFQKIAEERDIEFTIVEIAAINFSFTPDAFEKILMNLLSNAFKYTPKGNTVSFCSRISDNNELEIIVSDTGIGIPLDEQDTIFERFNRSTNINQENIPGAGIGLSLVKTLVEIHQGRIELKSKPKVGTSIRVFLPIIERVEQSEVNRLADEDNISMELMSIACQANYSLPDEQTAEAVQGNLNKILIIEDNDDMRDFLSRNISQNYQILTAIDGEQGVKIATDEIPDLIISDIMMPKLDGYQLTNRLRNQIETSHIPIILLTAKDDRISRLKGWHEKADEYITKPFDIEELNIRIKNLLDIRDILARRYSKSILKEFQVEKQTTESSTKQVELNFLSTLDSVLLKCYSNSQMKVPSIASEMSMSERQLTRKLKGLVGLTLNEYLRIFRLEKAKLLLISQESVTNVAYEVGFSSSSYFSNCFKAYAGCTPSEYSTQNTHKVN